MRKAFVFAVLCALAVVHAPDTRAADVVVSLKPIHSLVAGVMGEAGKPRLLLGGAASPHTYQMRPSEARALSEAELIVWIGEAMETFLERPIENLGSKAKIVTLHEAAGLRLLPNREGGIWDDDHSEAHADEHDDHSEAHVDEHDDHSEAHVDEHDDHSEAHVDEHDDHLTSTTTTAMTMASSTCISGSTPPMLAVLSTSSPTRSLAWTPTVPGPIAATRRWCETASPPWNRRFETGWRPCARMRSSYSTMPTSISSFRSGSTAREPSLSTPARLPGAKRLAELRAALGEHDVRCMFTEPQFESGLVRTVAEGAGIRTAALDPLGVDVEPGPDAWFKIMRGLGDAFSECLGGG